MRLSALSTCLAALLPTAVLVLAPGTPAVAGPTPPTAARGIGEALGYDRIGVRRSDTWYLRPDLGPGAAETYREHVGGWAPVAGDTDGDGFGTVSLFRDGIWRMSNGRGGAVREFRFGQKGDQPVLGDWDADGIDTVGVLRGGRWYLRDANSTGPHREFGFGIPGDVAVVGDWDGDGGTDIGVKRGSNWYQRDAADPGAASRTIRFGLAGDLPVSGDWDHDGRDTPGAFRDGTWFLRNAGGGYAQTRFGMRGDKPVVRRTAGLAPGVSHRVARDSSGFLAHVVTVDLAATSTPDVVLGTGRLEGTEVTSSMGRRSGAVVAVNGDYAGEAGRPVHLSATDGILQQTPTTRGRAMGLDLAGTGVSMGFPSLALSVQPDGASQPLPIADWNNGQPDSDEIVGFTSAGALLETPRGDACYAGLTEGRPILRDGVVETATTVTGRRCFGEPAMVPSTGSLLTANTFAAQQSTFQALTPGQGAVLRTTLGFPGAVDVVGGNPLLVRDGTVVDADVDGSSSFFARNPRTAVGHTADGRMLLVVVDGRQPGYSSGATLREMADLMKVLGAVNALNLDGGGSSTMWLNGVVANRPSDGAERGVSSALVVLPAGDPGEEGITSFTTGSARRTPSGPVTPLVPVAPQGGPADSLERAFRDPASSGGLSSQH